MILESIFYSSCYEMESNSIKILRRKEPNKKLFSQTFFSLEEMNDWKQENCYVVKSCSQCCKSSLFILINAKV